MAVLPFSTGQMTLIAVFLLMAHNLVQEGVVQAKSGTSMLKISLIRLFAAVVAVWIVAQFVDSETSMSASRNQTEVPADSLLLLSQRWLISMALLSFKMIFIICAVMVAIELMQRFDVQRYLVAVCSPLLKSHGSEPRSRLALGYSRSIRCGLRRCGYRGRGQKSRSSQTRRLKNCIFPSGSITP